MLVVKQHRKLLLNLRDPDRITTVIPTARMVVVKGQNLVAVPHREDEVRVLRNLGFDPPAPISTYYDWPGRYTPFIHQRTTAEFMTTNPRCFVLNGMGSGKTMSTLWAFHYLRSIGLVKRMLVVSPLSTLERAWGDEIFKNFFDLKFVVLHGSRERRHKLLESDADIYVINHDGIKSPETLRLLSEREGLDVVCIDELAEFSNATTDRWKALNHLCNPKVEVVGPDGKRRKVVQPRTWVWGLTGTPLPNGPTDAWAQIRLINPANVSPYFSGFRDQVMRPVTAFKWAARDNALQVVKEAMQPAIRFSREDCIDLPPVTYTTLQTTLTPEQQKAYDAMLRTFKAEHAGGQITAINAAVRVSKLVQICCGVAYGDDGDVLIPAKSRIDLVKELIRGSEGKVIVFAPLTGALNVLAQELRSEFTVEVVDGQTPKGKRDEIFKSFQQTPYPHVMVANAGTMSHGLSFTAASTTIWFAPGNSNRVRMQANERMARPGQTRNMLIANIYATPLELKMYASMDAKENNQDILLDLIKEVK